MASEQPADDLVLRVGPDRERLDLNSTCLRMASGVFNKMLGGSFKEASSSKIELPEDPATAFAVLVDLCHFRNPFVNYINVETFRDVAILQDKYDFKAAQLALTLWLEGSLPTGGEDLWYFMETAFLLDEAHAFKEITGKLVLTYVGSYLKFPKLYARLTSNLPGEYLSGVLKWVMHVDCR